MVLPASAKKLSWDIVPVADAGLVDRALDQTDPDPYAHAPATVDLQKRLEAFKSVTDLVCPKETPAQKYTQLYLIAEGYESQIRALSIPDLLAKLKTLEEKTFRYDPKTKEATIADAEAHLELKNVIKAIERAAFEDKEYLQKINLPEIQRLSILLADELTAKDRGLIYQVERENLAPDSFFSSLFAMRKEFYENYDGKTLFWENPLLRRRAFLDGYASIHWSSKDYLSHAQKFCQTHLPEFRALLLKSLSSQELDAILNDKEEDFWKKMIAAQSGFFQTKNPAEKIKPAFILDAIGMRLTLEAKNVKELNKEITERVVRSNFLYRISFLKPYLDQMTSPLTAGQEAMMTPTRLDNYQARQEFLDVAKGVIEKKLEKLEQIASTYKTTSRLRSSLLTQIDPAFNLLIGWYIATAEGDKIPFTPSDFLSLVDEKTSANIQKFLGGPVVDHPVSWKEVRAKGTVRIGLSNYPTTGKWYQNEWEILKRIDYNGCSVYDLAASVIDNVTLSSSEVDGDIEMLGQAKAFYKNIFVAYRGGGRKSFSFHRRLGIVAHEAFHSIEETRFFSGLGTGFNLGVLRERNAYFFEAYVLEEYLKLRWQERKTIPISKREVRDLLRAIIEARKNGLTGNAIAKEIDHDFDLDDRRIELPLLLEHKVATVAVEAMKDSAKKGEMKKLMNQHPGKSDDDFWVMQVAQQWNRNHPQSEDPPKEGKGMEALFNKAIKEFYHSELQKIAGGLFKGFDIGSR